MGYNKKKVKMLYKNPHPTPELKLQWRTQEFWSRRGGGGSTNSDEGRGQRTGIWGGGSPLPPSQGFWRQL